MAPTGIGQNLANGGVPGELKGARWREANVGDRVSWRRNDSKKRRAAGLEKDVLGFVLDNFQICSYAIERTWPASLLKSSRKGRNKSELLVVTRFIQLQLINAY